jgi:hypothetical protein
MTDANRDLQFSWWLGSFGSEVQPVEVWLQQKGCQNRTRPDLETLGMALPPEVEMGSTHLLQNVI